MTLKAKLKVVLQADDTIVAESEDGALWQRVLEAIHSGRNDSITGPAQEHSLAGKTVHQGGQRTLAPTGAAEAPINKLAAQLQLPVETVQGALSPSTSAPYLHLDAHCWEAMRATLPQRGTGAISPIQLAATVLGLWFQIAKLGTPKQADAQAVLGTINIRDPNPTRGVKAADWLQTRAGGVLVLNPARIGRAVSIARSFCSQEWGAANE